MPHRLDRPVEEGDGSGQLEREPGVIHVVPGAVRGGGCGADGIPGRQLALREVMPGGGQRGDDPPEVLVGPVGLGVRVGQNRHEPDQQEAKDSRHEVADPPPPQGPAIEAPAVAPGRAGAQVVQGRGPPPPPLPRPDRSGPGLLGGRRFAGDGHGLPSVSQRLASGA